MTIAVLINVTDLWVGDCFIIMGEATVYMLVVVREATPGGGSMAAVPLNGESRGRYHMIKETDLVSVVGNRTVREAFDFLDI